MRIPLAITLFLLLCLGEALAAKARQIVVAKDGTGDFESIGQAIDSLGMYNYERVTIWVKNGVYREKLVVRQDYVTLLGESREKTVIEMDLPRSLYLDAPDEKGPAVLNVYGDDFILESITVSNTHEDKDVHAFAVYGEGTRTVVQDCNVWSNGGDTLSLWNYKEGMYYHARCDFRGAVDFVCPRGWCYIEDSQFTATKDTVAIWHAGPYEKGQKFVIREGRFDGWEEFTLGRHHYEAQFYLIDCFFSERVKDQEIYFVSYEDPSRNRPYVWGDRHYFSGAKGPGVRKWMGDNLDEAPHSPMAKEVTAKWTFGGRWDPLDKAGPQVLSIVEDYRGVRIDLSETVAIYGEPLIELESGQRLEYLDGSGSRTLLFKGSLPGDVEGAFNGATIVGGEIVGNVARSKEAYLDFQ